MAETSHVLIVDDDENIRFFLAEALHSDGHNVTAVESGEEALESLRSIPFNLAILDLRLAGRIDGIRVLEAIKWRWPDMATIILTGHGSLDSALAAIREGIDAYLLKPVRAQEIRQTVADVLSRQKAVPKIKEVEEEPSTLQRGPFLIDLHSRQVTVGGKVLELTACEYELLLYLIHNAQRVIPPPELVRVVRQYECDHLQEARDVIKWYIYRLRRKVEPNPSRPRHILNVRGVGYTFKE